MKNKKIIIIMVGILLLIFSGFIGYIAFRIVNGDHSTKINNPEEDSIIITQKDVDDIYEQTLKTSYILLGDVKTDTDNTVLDNTYTYYHVSDDVLKDIKSIDDIISLINKTFSGDLSSKVFNNFVDQKYNKYYMTDDTLFVLKMDNACKKFEFSKNSYEYKQDLDEAIVYGDKDLNITYGVSSWYAKNLINPCE